MSDSFSILVVDDTPSLAESLTDILTVKGYIVYAASSGAEALKILKSHHADILLTDVRMPDMDGVTLHQAIRKTHPDIFTILMTAYAADDIIQRGMTEGIKTILSKPLDIDFLLTLFSTAKRLSSKGG